MQRFSVEAGHLFQVSARGLGFGGPATQETARLGFAARVVTHQQTTDFDIPRLLNRRENVAVEGNKGGQRKGRHNHSAHPKQHSRVPRRATQVSLI